MISIFFMDKLQAISYNDKSVQSAGNQLSASVISTIYPEDSIDLFMNIKSARKILSSLLSGIPDNKIIKETDLIYVKPSKFGFEPSLQHIYFTFRNNTTGAINWIRLNRGISDKKPIFDTEVQGCDWGEI